MGHIHSWHGAGFNPTDDGRSSRTWNESRSGARNFMNCIHGA